ncbi:ERF family protein [Bacillus mycoides]|uniref:ERF family protein n=1 Tax=Bacillus mycoides TaxID=1405 RepID=UPI002079236F|nr:ERF family protein [Bacillus mycoides]
MNKSETITELAKALVKFNSEVNKIAKDADNPFFKNNYATLDTIIDEIRPILSKHGLSIMQIPSGDGQNVTLKTLLLHESGEWLESDELTMKPVKNDPQAVGSCITYARRYSLAAFLSLNTGEDDDGNGATYGKGNKPNQKSNSGQAPNNQKKEDLPLPTNATEGAEIVLTFGKHEGKTLRTIFKENKGYLEWLVKNDKADDRIKTAINMMFQANQQSA